MEIGILLSVWVRILKWENYPELPGSVLNVSTSVVKGGRRRETWRCHPTGIKDGGWGHTPKNRRKAAPEAGRAGKAARLFLAPLERAKPCQHLDLSLVKPLLTFGHQNWKRINVCCFKPSSFFFFFFVAVTGNKFTLLIQFRGGQ